MSPVSVLKFRYKQYFLLLKIIRAFAQSKISEIPAYESKKK